MPVLELPIDHARPAVSRQHGGNVGFSLSVELTRELKNLSREEGTTLFMTLLAVFQILLSHYSAQTDIAVGSPVAGRSRRELESLIGFFVNTIVLRNDLSGNPAFRQLLSRVRENTLSDLAHQEVPFEKLVEELAPERSRGRNPLFQTMLMFQNTPSADLHLPGLELTRQEVNTSIAKFDLTMQLTEEGGRFQGALEYDSELFDTWRIQRMAEHWQQLLESIVSDPTTPICHLSMLTNTERHQILVEWNDNERSYPAEKCVHHLFEERATQAPESVAVVCGDQQWSYRELQCRSNQLGHYLRKTWHRPGSKSWNLLAAWF